ncbi:MAG TPA: ABC transporter substrate-binding protein [Burkholderiales bacterium]|nr:ABC transporter substrate-binding protein [Burkholderiales bacterium]
MMKALGRLVVLTLALCAPVLASAQASAPVIVINLVELSGAAAIAGTNFANGVELAFKEINAAGGILGQRIQLVTLDTETKPELAKALAQRALALKPYAVMGPVFSGITLAAMGEMQAAEVPTFTGGEAASLTQQGNPYLFRTSFNQLTAMPRLARYIKDVVRARTVAVVWVDNEFGRGGRDAMTAALDAVGVKVGSDVSTSQQQADFAPAVAKLKAANADAAFVYLNEEESGRFLRELQKQGYDRWVLGETTLVGQKVLELAGDAANGVQAHVGLTPDALLPNVRTFDNKYLKEYRYRSDHNGMKGYSAAYVLKAVTEKIGRFDSKELARAMKGIALSAKEYPGILLDVKYDDKGDLDRASFIVRVSGGRHEFIATLPPSTPIVAGPAAAKK